MKQKILIIGAGFAGVQLATNLDEELFDILLIDKVNHHQFQPLFYQVATSQIEPSAISFPIRYVFRNKTNIQIRLAEVTNINTNQNIISTTIGEFGYDILIIAMGCKTNFFGNEEIQKYALTLKSTYEAITIRNHILQIFEDVISAPEDKKEELLNLVIVGAGATGVELSGAFAEIKKHVLERDYPRVDLSKFNIYLIEGSKHTLNNMSEKSKNTSEKYLKKMGVNVLTETFVKNYDGTTLSLSNGNSIKTKTVIWAAGVTANFINGLPEGSIVSGNRIKVDRTNKVYSCENIYAIGDICYMETPLYPKGHPQVANVAINQGKTLAKNLKSMIQGLKTVEYEYKDFGSMATIGTNKAVVDLKYFQLKGYLAWYIWMFLHLMLILSVKNKLIIFINWAWAYITKDSSLRLILIQDKKSKQP